MSGLGKPVEILPTTKVRWFAAWRSVTTRKEIRQFANRVAQEFRPQKIILFGSYAYGKPTAASDVDLLVVMPVRGDTVRKAVEIELQLRARFPLDLLVRTPQKVRRRLALDDWFMRDILEKGTVLSEAADA